MDESLEIMEKIKVIAKNWEQIDFEEVYNMIYDAESKDEGMFYWALGDAILQLRQKKVIAAKKW